MDINTHSTLKTNLASYWTLDTNFNDSHTGAHHGTFYNTPTFPVAKLRTGAKFVAASSQYGKVTNHADFQGATMTFAFWFKVDALPASTQWLLGHSQGGTLNRNVQLDSGGTVYVTFPDAVLPVTVPSMAPIVAGRWYHLLAFQGSGVVAFYLNNVDQGTIPSFTPAGVSADIYLGSNPTPGQYFNGIIDDFGWWNKILSSDERNDLYQSGIGITWNGTFTSIETHPTLRSGLLAHYKFDGDANDILGNFNGTPVGSPTYEAGKIGQAVLLNGSTQSIDLSDAAGLDPDYVSVVAWVRRTGGSVFGGLVTRRSGPHTSYNFSHSDSGGWDWVVEDGGGTWRVAYQPGTDSNWHMLVGTWDGAYCRSSKDGGAFTSVAGTAGPIPKHTLKTVIGDSHGGGMPFGGDIDSVSIYNRAILISEVTDLYNSGSGLPWSSGFTCISDHPTLPTGLLAHYKLDGDLTDSKGAYNLTQYGTMQYDWGKNGYAGFMVDQGSCGYTNATMQPSYVSIAGWVKIKTYPIPGSAEHFLAVKKGDPFTLKTGDSGANFQAIINTSGGNKSLTTSWGDTNWHFVAMTYDGSNLKIYKDANAPVSSAHSGTLNTSTQDFILGAYTTTAGWGSACWQDGFSVWNRALTAQEVADLYNSGNGLPYDTNPLSSSVFISNASGDWSNPATWGQADYPVAGDVVTVNPGHTVQIDGNHTLGNAPNDSTPVLTIYGTLKWKIQESTGWTFNCRGSAYLRGGGTLQVGSLAEPIPATQTANFIFEKSTSTATLWYLYLANFTDGDKTQWGNLSIYGNPSHHMADAAKQRTYLTYGVASGSDKTIVFDDAVDYSVGDTIWIGYGGDPTIDPFNGTAIAAAYGSDTVTIKTKIDARTYTADLTYTHVAGDFVIHKTRNVFFGCQDADNMKISPILYSTCTDPASRTDWAGSISVNWAHLNKLEEIFRATGPFCFTDTTVPQFKNCIVQAPTYGTWVTSVSVNHQHAWFETTVPFWDELHIFKLSSWFTYDLRAFETGILRWGHVSVLDIMMMANDGNYHGFISDYNQETRNNQMLEWDSAWVSWDRSHSNFGYQGVMVRWRFGLKINSMKARVIPGGFNLMGLVMEGQEVLFNDMQVQHCYGAFIRTQSMSGTAFSTMAFTNCKFANLKSGFSAALLGGSQPNNLEFYDCTFDGIASHLIYCGSDGRQAFFTLQWKFVNCTFGMMLPNAYMLTLENIWFRVSGRVLFENCQIKKPTNVTASGVWTGIKGYCIRMTASYPYDGYLPTSTTFRQLMPPHMTYEWVNCKIYDDSGIDQFAIEYPNKVCAVVGGGGELLAETATIIDGTLGMKMVPYAVHAPHPGNKAKPIRVPLVKGEAVTLKASLRKNVSLPVGKRPTFNARGCGLDLSSEMTDVINTWEEQTLTGTALYDDTLEVWVTGGWNLYAGTTDDFWTPTALGTVVSYADKFSCVLTAAPAPKVLSAQSVALNKVRLNFNRPMRITDEMLNSGLGISESSLASGLIAHYKFDGNLTDSGPNGLNGTEVGGPLTYPEGKINTGLYLNGSQHVNCAANALWNPTNISIFAWVRHDSRSATIRIVHKQNVGDGVHYALGMASGTQIWGAVNTSSGETQYGSSISADFNLGWHLYGMIYDGSYVKLWVDDRCVLKTAKTGNLISVATLVNIGSYHNGGYALYGMVDELVIHNRGLTDVEAMMLYNNGRGMKYTDASSMIYEISGGKTPLVISPRGFEAVELTLDSDMTPGSSYTAGVIASSGLVDQNGVAFDDANRTASFTCHNSIQTHPTLSDGSLCGAWLFDGNANDSSGNGYHGTIVGSPTFVSGKIGQGINFAGTAGNGIWVNPMYLDRKKLGCLTKLMVSCWVKFNTLTATSQWLVSKYATEVKANSDNNHWCLYKDTSNVIQFSIPSGAITGPAATTSWVHFVVGFDGKTSVMYVNGVLHGSATASQPRHKPTYPLIPIRIGGCCVDADPPYPETDVTFVPDAIIDQVLHFNRLLTPDEVKAIYNAGNGLAF